MKNLPVLFCVITCITTVSCVYRHHDPLITYNESRHYYSMYANFSSSKTRDVDEYIDSRLGRLTNMSFVNSRINGTIALDDHTIFYIRKYPGFIRIKFDKYKNSDEAYENVKEMCEGIKEVLIEEGR